MLFTVVVDEWSVVAVDTSVVAVVSVVVTVVAAEAALVVELEVVSYLMLFCPLQWLCFIVVR